MLSLVCVCLHPSVCLSVSLCVVCGRGLHHSVPVNTINIPIPSDPKLLLPDSLHMAPVRNHMDLLSLNLELSIKLKLPSSLPLASHLEIQSGWPLEPCLLLGTSSSCSSSTHRAVVSPVGWFAVYCLRLLPGPGIISGYSITWLGSSGTFQKEHSFLSLLVRPETGADRAQAALRLDASEAKDDIERVILLLLFPKCWVYSSLFCLDFM